MRHPNNPCVRLVLLACLLVPMGLSQAAEPAPSLEQRMERLERILRNQSLADIILQLQQLQQEVQQLRGEVELQKHTLDAQNKRQRDLYIDLDQRLSRLLPATGTGTPAVQVTEQPTPTQQDALTPPPSTGETVPAVAATVSPQPPPPTADAPPLPPPDPKAEAEAYQKAFNLLKQGRYQESIGAFRDFLANYPGGTYEDNAQYWLGEASYVSRDFDVALTEFTRVLERYPNSSKVPGALLKSGYIHYEKQDWAKAREFFGRLQAEHAGSTEARLAGKRLERMDKEGR